MSGASPEISAAIDRMLIELFDLPAQQVTPDARLREDLDLDSLDGVDLTVQIEKAFRIRLDDEAVRGIRTVGGIHVYVAELVAGSSAAR
jgi:acyl carrier protein